MSHNYSNSICRGLANFFRYEELKEATVNFHSSQVLGDGSFGVVYRGKLRGQTVAVKKLYSNNEKLVEQFINEVAILSHIRHPNLVRFLGRTNQRNQELFMVYEFVPNGTVADHLRCQRSALTLEVRFQITLETANALAYLHSLEPSVIHRDVKTPNILLDHDLHVKVADFGICRLLPWDATHVLTVPQGTVGYRDPEYDSSFRLSDKSDVYSFGVVLLELVSGMEAVDVNRGPDLDAMVLKKINSFKLKDIVDPTLGYHSDINSKRMINSVAELARECLHPKGMMRPTMVQVLKALTDIKDQKHKIDDRCVPGVQAYAFSREEILQATESFHQSRHLGNRKYLGYFDGLMMLVKERDERDITRISQFRHKNLASLYGGTKPDNMDKMFLVYEYVPNSSVGHHLHRPCEGLLIQNEERIALNWALRFRIAIETAEAISYLHLFIPPVTFGKLTTYNILLDENYHVKLTGLLRLWRYSYKPGYYKPSMDGLQEDMTCDIYNFGVVLFELLSGKQVLSLHRMDLTLRLAVRAPGMIRDELDQFVDENLDYHSNLDTKRMVNSVANLACRCVERDRKMRPTMSEVLSLLKKIEDGST